MVKKYFGMVSTAASLSYTNLALRSFFECTELGAADCFFLIDNDGSFSADSLGALAQRLTMIRNPDPRGFAANANQVIARALAARADLYFLNNDLAFSPGWIDPLLAAEPVILSPYSNNEIQYRSNHFQLEPHMDLSQYKGRETAFRQMALLHSQSFSGYQPVMILPFFCVKIPYQVLKAVGYFDEGYGPGGAEDYDYCLRAALCGFTVCFTQGSYVLHFGGKSSWSGVLNHSDRTELNQEFCRRFQEKWGNALFRVCFREESDFLRQNPELNQALEQRNYGQLIQLLCAADGAAGLAEQPLPKLELIRLGQQTERTLLRPPRERALPLRPLPIN